MQQIVFFFSLLGMMKGRMTRKMSCVSFSHFVVLKRWDQFYSLIQRLAGRNGRKETLINLKS